MGVLFYYLSFLTCFSFYPFPFLFMDALFFYPFPFLFMYVLFFSCFSSCFPCFPLKEEFPFLADVSSVILQQTLRDQQEAFKHFWAGRATYPKFKKRYPRQSIRLTKAAFAVKNGQLLIAKSKEPLNIRWSRTLSSEPSSITICKRSKNPRPTGRGVSEAKN